MNVLYAVNAIINERFFLLLKLEMCVQDIISVIQDLHVSYLKVKSHWHVIFCLILWLRSCLFDLVVFWFKIVKFFSLVFSEWNAARSGSDPEIDSAGAEYSPFLPSNTPGLLLGHFHLYYEAPLNQLCSFDRIWAESMSLLYTSDFIITKHSNQSHWKHAHASHCSMFHRWCCMLRSSAVLLHTSFFPSFCVHFKPIFIIYL